MKRCFLLPALFAASAAAEVRLDPITHEVRVIVTPSGPWTDPRRLPGALNVQGDVEGDGAPAISASPSGTLVAWSSPSRGELRLARAGSQWLPTRSVAAPGITGTPLVVRVEGGWLVAVRQDDGRVGVAGLLDRGDVSELAPLGEGRLLSGRRTDRDAQFVLLTRERCLETISVRFLVPDPRPIDVYRTRTCLPPGEPARPPSGRDGDPFRPPPPDGGDRRGMSLDPVAGEGIGEDGRPVTRIEWQAEDGVAHVIEVDDLGLAAMSDSRRSR